MDALYYHCKILVKDRCFILPLWSERWMLYPTKVRYIFITCYVLGRKSEKRQFWFYSWATLILIRQATTAIRKDFSYLYLLK